MQAWGRGEVSRGLSGRLNRAIPASVTFALKTSFFEGQKYGFLLVALGPTAGMGGPPAPTAWVEVWGTF